MFRTTDFQLRVLDDVRSKHNIINIYQTPPNVILKYVHICIRREALQEKEEKVFHFAVEVGTLGTEINAQKLNLLKK